MTVSGDRATIGRWVPCAAVAIVCLLALAARGIRWDETWEHAQILAGLVGYPQGHPLAVYVHNAFSFQTWLAGMLVKTGMGPFALCLFRNGLFLLATGLPVFFIVSTLTRSAVGGAVAAVLIFQGILLAFDGSYPTMVWPELYSNGHIGGGAVLIALWTLAAGRLHLAYFLTGLLPMVHLGQWPPLAGVVGVHIAWVGWQAWMDSEGDGQRPSLAPCLGYGAAGVVCAALFWLVHRQTLQPLPEAGPFAAEAGSNAVWRGYTALHDPHRAFPPANGHIVLAGAILLGVLAAWSGPDKAFRRACCWLAIFCAGIGAAVWGTMAIHASLGANIPFLLIAWMPYRLINLVPPVLLAMAVSAILLRWGKAGWWCLAGALGASLLHPLWATLFGPAMYGRYLAHGEFVAFGLYGFALVAVGPRHGPGRFVIAALAAMVLLALATVHQFGAVCIVAGVLGGCGICRLQGTESRPAPRAARAALILAGVATLVLLGHQLRFREPLPVTPFQATAREVLREEHPVMVAGPPDSILLQATIGQPVLAEAATPSLISYVPAIGPAIDRLYRDLYGYGFAIPEPDAPAPLPWQTVWQLRSHHEWRTLAQRYGLTHVIAPIDTKLQLPAVTTGGDYRLYAISAE